MRITYDRDVDAITILFRNDTPVAESDESAPGVILDYDFNGTLVSIEVLDASKRFADVDHVEFETTAHQR